ncbi:hypothetical protein MTO96_050985 [Rhipicephalus appendiculatus]
MRDALATLFLIRLPFSNVRDAAAVLGPAPEESPLTADLVDIRLETAACHPYSSVHSSGAFLIAITVAERANKTKGETGYGRGCPDNGDCRKSCQKQGYRFGHCRDTLLRPCVCS